MFSAADARVALVGVVPFGGMVCVVPFGRVVPELTLGASLFALVLGHLRGSVDEVFGKVVWKFGVDC